MCAAVLGVAQVCVGLAPGHVAIEGFGKIQPQLADVHECRPLAVESGPNIASANCYWKPGAVPCKAKVTLMGALPWCFT